MGLDGAEIKARRIKSEAKAAENHKKRASKLAKCPACNHQVSKNAGACPSCGEPLKREAAAIHNRVDRTTITGIVATATLAAGVFCPIFSVPVVGSINYFANGKGDGVALLIFAGISLILLLVNQKKLLIYTGGGSLIFLGYTFYSFSSKMSEISKDMEADLAGNPFRGLADIALNSVQMQWGWAVLVTGATLLVAAGYLASQEEKQTS